MPSSTVDQIKERLDIVQVVGAYIKLEKAGASLKAKCPFHNEKTPSFFVSPARGSYYCFGCGAKGDIFSFVEQFEGLDFVGALKVLAAKAGVELGKENLQAKTEREKLFAVMEESANFFAGKLKENPEAGVYIAKRGLSKKTIAEWRIGYAPDSWRDCISYLKKKGFKEPEIEKAGMIKRSDNPASAERFYDRFRGRVMFPIFDSSGRVIAFSGRILKADDNSAKYLNSPETPLFTKSKVLYGFHKAKNDIRTKDYSILVEGQMDLLMAQQSGYGNTVASSGTAFTPDHMEILKRLSNRIILAFDPDGAGINAAKRSAAIALPLGMEVKVAMIAEEMDPAEAILEKPKLWADALRGAKHIVSFCLEDVLSKNSDPRAVGKGIKNEVLPFVAMLESSIEKSQFVAEISGKTGIKENAIWDDLKKTEKNLLSASPESKMKNISSAGSTEEKKEPLRLDSIERKILGIILWQESRSADKAAVPADILPEKIKERFSEIAGSEIFKKDFVEALKIKDELIFEAEAYYHNKESLAQEVENLFANLEEEFTKIEIEKTMRELGFAEKGKRQSEVDEFTKKFNELSKKLAGIKKKARK